MAKGWDRALARQTSNLRKITWLVVERTRGLAHSLTKKDHQRQKPTCEIIFQGCFSRVEAYYLSYLVVHWPLLGIIKVDFSGISWNCNPYFFEATSSLAGLEILVSTSHRIYCMSEAKLIRLKSRLIK